jgi:hypothetical protein
MSIEITDVSAEYWDLIIEFYSKYGDKKKLWYFKKLKDDIFKGKVIGKFALDKKTGIVVSCYLARIQPLLSNLSLKAVQSIDTLTAPHWRRGDITFRLAKNFYEHLKQNSFDCIYGLPSIRADKFFYKILKWNFSTKTHCYIVYIPIFILRFFFSCISFFIKKDLFNFNEERICELKNFLFINDKCIENKKNSVYWISYDGLYFADIGLCRTGSKLNFFKKLYLLMIFSSTSKSFFLRTYATEQAETAKIFSPFSFKKKALDFSGRILKENSKLPFNLKLFEFVEFDTFGLE